MSKDLFSLSRAGVAAIGLFSICCFTACMSPAARSFSQGMSYLAEKNFAKAETAFRQAIESLPNSPEYHWRLAEALQLQGKYTDAIREYEAAAACSTDNILKANALGRIGDCYYGLGLYKDAAGKYEEHLKMSPRFFDHYEKFFEACRQIGELERLRLLIVECLRDMTSERVVEYAVPKLSDTPLVGRLFQGQVHESGRQGDIWKGLAIFRLQYALVNLCMYEGQYEEAGTIATNAARFWRSPDTSFENLGMPLPLPVGGGLFVFLSAQGLDKQKIAARFDALRGWIHLHMGLLDKAEEDLRRSVKLGSDLTAETLGFPFVLILNDKAREAVGYLRKAVSAYPNDLGNRSLLYVAYRRTGEGKKAESEFGEINKLINSTNWSGGAFTHGDDYRLLFLGFALAEANEAELAVKYYEEALRLAPSSLVGLRLLAEAHLQTGRRQEALAAINRAIALFPYDALSSQIKGRCFLQKR